LAAASSCASLLAQSASEHLIRLKALLSEQVVTHLIIRKLMVEEPLGNPSLLRIDCNLPGPPLDPQALAPAYRVHYRVRGHSLATGNLDDGAEVHIAPEGAAQAIERVFIHLRQRWYPAASEVVVG